MYDNEETETYDVDFALSLMGKEPRRVLEIACGSGRFLVPFAKAGHDITGLDFDEHMLNRIKAKAEGLGNIHWKKSDVINEDWDKGFDVVLLAANFLSNIVSDMDIGNTYKIFSSKKLSKVDKNTSH